MIGFYVLLGGIVLVVGAFTLVDWLGRRGERPTHDRPVR